MKRTKQRQVITASQRMLDFANLPKVESREKIDELLRPNTPALWNSINEDDAHGFASLIDLHSDTQDRLEKLLSGKTRHRKKILEAVVRETQDASVQANVQGAFKVPLPCVPKVAVEKGVVMVKNEWLTTGAHAAVVFGLLELFVDKALGRLSRCRNCSRFYLKTPRLRVACSIECRRILRIKDIAENVREHRRRRRIARRLSRFT